MKKIITFLASGCFLFASMQGYAQAPVTVYEGTTLPTNQGWNELKLDNTVSSAAADVSQTVNDGVLKLTSVNLDNKFSQLAWFKTGLELNRSVGYTIEIKAKINNAAKRGAFNIQGYDNEGQGFRLGIYDTFLAESTNPLAATNIVSTDLDNSDKFYIFRLVVAPTGLVSVYRDGAPIGNFPLAAFQFDNIIENGGFEDGDDLDLTDSSFFPDFQSNGLLYRTSDSDKKYYGDYALIMDSNGKTEKSGDDFDPATSERARTREIAVKPGTAYDISITRLRVKTEPWAWRDMGAFYDFHQGTQNGEDVRNQNAMWAGVNDDFWQIHNQTITTPLADAENPAASLRFEFPSWTRDNDKTTAANAFDNFIFRERTGLVVGPTIATGTEMVIPAGITNLIENGSFEDHTINNDGTPYEWALSILGDGGDNNSVKVNDMWGGNVRIQRHDQTNDHLGGQWARTGTSSLRFSTQGNRNNSFNFTKVLEPNKTYCFNFWHRSPRWPDWGWLKVKIGSGNDIWGHELMDRNNVWANSNIIFTTTATDYTLNLYTNFDSHGDWWNLYLDDLVLYEVTGDIDPQLLGKTNLIANGNFEDPLMGNDGEPYTWALASEYAGDDDNYPVAYSDVWGSYVRLQDKQKRTDTGLRWANSGNKSLRFSFLNDRNQAKTFEGIPAESDDLPNAYRVNMNFNKELEANKTYTFVFWFKAANYGDRGTLTVATGERKIWEQEMSTKYINWTRQSVTFTTTDRDRTLKIYTQFTGWFNFYLDDLFLYEEDVYVPVDGESYLFFGKSTGTESTDVEIEYVKVDNTGAFAPDTGTDFGKIINFSNLNVRSINNTLVIDANVPSTVNVYNLAGVLVERAYIETTKSFNLQAGVYIIKSVSKAGKTEAIKVVNN